MHCMLQISTQQVLYKWLNRVELIFLCCVRTFLRARFSTATEIPVKSLKAIINHQKANANKTMSQGIHNCSNTMAASESNERLTWKLSFLPSSTFARFPCVWNKARPPMKIKSFERSIYSNFDWSAGNCASFFRLVARPSNWVQTQVVLFSSFFYSPANAKPPD